MLSKICFANLLPQKSRKRLRFAESIAPLLARAAGALRSRAAHLGRIAEQQTQGVCDQAPQALCATSFRKAKTRYSANLGKYSLREYWIGATFQVHAPGCSGEQ